MRVTYTQAHLAGLSHGDLSVNVAFIHVLPNSVCIVTPVCTQPSWLQQIVSHDQIEPKAVGCLSRRDLCSHGQAMRVEAEMDLGHGPP